jgi:tetraprenyl-beta-curcumene synthase
MDDPTPLDSRQFWALAMATTREVLWGLPAVSAEIRRWRVRALGIPNPTIRADALSALRKKRTHADGAALFWILPRRRNLDLLRLLVSYELIWDLLDNLSERAAAAGRIDGRQLHLAIAEAIDPSASISDYYRDCPWRGDGGYLRALVESCQQGCLKLPSYPQVRALALVNAERAQVLALNHDPNAARRDASLERWVKERFPASPDLRWWELSGAASAPLTIHALLALAAERECRDIDVAAVQDAYFPWLSAATTMLDSYVDQAEDLKSGNHSYISHYPSGEGATMGIQRLIARAASEVRGLPDGPKHAIIAAAMAAMYLSKSGATAPAVCARTRSLAKAGGSLTALLLPILRAWRVVYAQSTS